MPVSAFLVNLIPALILSYILQLILHEAGHMIGGLLTGWRLVYIKVFGLAFVRRSNEYRFMIVRDQGCSCIMYPRKLTSRGIIYTLGGCIINLVITITSLISSVRYIYHPIAWLYLWSIFASGIAFLITNAIPKTKRICNDMACYLLLIRGKKNILCENAQMMIAKQLMESITYRQMDKELFQKVEKKADNDILAFYAVLECYYHLDNDEYTKAKAALEKVDIGAAISSVVMKNVKMEKLYLDLLLHMLDKTPMQNLYYGGEINQYIRENEALGDIHSWRVIALYEAYTCMEKDDYEQAIKFITAGIEKINQVKCLYPGDKLFCMDQLMAIVNILKRDLQVIQKCDSMAI